MTNKKFTALTNKSMVDLPAATELLTRGHEIYVILFNKIDIKEPQKLNLVVLLVNISKVATFMIPSYWYASTINSIELSKDSVSQLLLLFINYSY